MSKRKTKTELTAYVKIQKARHEKNIAVQELRELNNRVAELQKRVDELEAEVKAKDVLIIKLKLILGLDEKQISLILNEAESLNEVKDILSTIQRLGL